MPTGIFVHLDSKTSEALRELARREYRRPRDQAAVLLREALRRALEAAAEQDEARPEATERAP